MRKMRDDGVRKALAIATSVFSSYSGCRQYLEDIEKARAEVGEGAPLIDKVRSFYNHPLFIEAQAEEVQAALEQIPAERRSACRILFTAHSVPVAMAETSNYQAQLHEACRLVAEQVKFEEWRLVFQSRSGAPGQPWLEPDVGDVLREMGSGQDVVVVPIGFISDHMEVLYDLDTEAQAIAAGRGVNMLRAATVGIHPKFVGMLRELILERMGLCEPRAIGKYGPNHDVCPADCCPAPARPSSGPAMSAVICAQLGCPSTQRVGGSTATCCGECDGSPSKVVTVIGHPRAPSASV